MTAEMDENAPQCTACPRPARMAIRTQRDHQRGMRSTVYYDDREAPKPALRYCKQHGVQTIGELAKVLVHEDEED